MKPTALQTTLSALIKTSIAAISGLTLNANAVASSLESQILSFEESSQPAWIIADNSQLTSIRSIHGSQSLLWQWQQNQQLTLTHTFERVTDAQATSAYGRGATQVLSFWLYNPVAIDDSLTVQLSDNEEKQVTTFPVKLNFSGWRTIGVSLNLDFKQAVTNQLEQIRFTAPNNSDITSGQLYIDRVMVSVDDNRYQWSDNQVTTRFDLPVIDFGLPDNLPVPTQTELDDAESVRQALITEFGGISESLASLENRFNAFGISKDSHGNITGRHILTDKQQVLYQPAHLASKDKTDFDQYVLLGDADSKGNKQFGYAQLMLDIGKAYHEPAFSADKARLADMYLLMTEHLLDQGFADGSALVTSHHWGYSGRWWYISALMMADELASNQLLQPTYQALLWFSREFKDSFDMALGPASSNLDYFNTLSRQHLALALLNPDPSERIAMLHRFSSFFSGALMQTPPGTNDGFRPDGTAWRHNGHYPGYAFPAFENAAHVAYMLKGTQFSLETKALNALKSVMIAGWHYSNPYIPLALSGRHPFTDLSVSRYSNGLKWLANSYSSADEELAAIYLQVTNTSEQQSDAIFGKRVTPALLPQGSWSYNGGAFTIHRNGDRMAVIKGYNQDVWSSEIYTNDNRYGRYQSHGSVHVIPYGDPSQQGYLQEGWDWNRNPGATTIHLGYDELESPKTSTLMVRSDEGLSGSTTLQDKYSLFSFKHKAPQNLANFEPSFVAQKFVLTSDDKLFLAGREISNSDSVHRTETTLFQLAIDSKSAGIWINGRQYTQPVFSTKLGSGDWLIDDKNVGYFLLDVSEVIVNRGLQTSRHNKTKQQTSGNFSSAWIDHGVAPDKEKYQYVILMNTNPEKMAAFAQQMKREQQFTLAESSDNGVTLYDSSNKLYGYNSFSANNYNQGPVKSVNSTSLVLAQLDRKELNLSIASPNINIQDNDQPTLPVTIEVEVEGEWDITGTSYSHQHGNTKISVVSLFSLPVNLKLTQDGGNSNGSNGGTDNSGNSGNNNNGTNSSSSGGSTSFTMIILLMALLGRRKPN